MQTKTPTEDEPGDGSTDDCTCTVLMPCWRCYRAGRRGRPAIHEVASR